MVEIEAWRRPLVRKEDVPLGSDLVSFFMIAPVLGSLLASLGLWILPLAFNPLGALVITTKLGGLSALASLAAARSVRAGYLPIPLVTGFAGAIAMVVVLWMGDVLSFPVIDWREALWIGSAFVCGELAFMMSRLISRPLKAAMVVLAPFVIWWVIWWFAVRPNVIN